MLYEDLANTSLDPETILVQAAVKLARAVDHPPEDFKQWLVLSGLDSCIFGALKNT